MTVARAIDNAYADHLCFKQAHLKMCHSTKVDDGVEPFFDNLLNTYFWTFFVCEAL